MTYEIWVTLFVGIYTLGFYGLTLAFCLHNAYMYVYRQQIYK